MIMIMLHNNQLQNQCFRPSITQRHNSNTPTLPTHTNYTLLNHSKLKRSQSTDSNAPQILNSSQSKGQNKSSSWLSNHFLDIKQKFKEIFKHKNSEIKRCEATARKNSVHSRIKQRNLSVTYQSGVVPIDNKKLMENLSFRPFQNKKLIDLKKGRLFRGMQRNNCNDRLAKRIDCENQFQQLLESPIEMDISDDEMGESYLKSQFAALQRKRQQQQTIRTQKRTLQSSRFTKHRSQVKTSHVPICLQLEQASPSKLIKRQSMLNINQINTKSAEKHLILGLKRSSLNRKVQIKKQIIEEGLRTSKGSFGLILQI